MGYELLDYSHALPAELAVLWRAGWAAPLASVQNLLRTGPARGGRVVALRVPDATPLSRPTPHHCATAKPQVVYAGRQGMRCSLGRFGASRGARLWRRVDAQRCAASAGRFGLDVWVWAAHTTAYSSKRELRVRACELRVLGWAPALTARSRWLHMPARVITAEGLRGRACITRLVSAQRRPSAGSRRRGARRAQRLLACGWPVMTGGALYARTSWRLRRPQHTCSSLGAGWAHGALPSPCWARGRESRRALRRPNSVKRWRRLTCVCIPTW